MSELQVDEGLHFAAPHLHHEHDDEHEGGYLYGDGGAAGPCGDALVPCRGEIVEDEARDDDDFGEAPSQEEIDEADKDLDLDDSDMDKL